MNKIGKLKDFRTEDSNFKNVNELTFLEQKELLNRNGFIIRYIKNPPEALQLEAVKDNWRALQYIKNPAKRVINYALDKSNGRAIMYIKNPPEALQLEAVERDGEHISFIKNPSRTVRIAAVRSSSSAILYIKNPTREEIEIAASVDGDILENISIDYIDDELVKIALKSTYVPEPSFLGRLDLSRETLLEVICIDPEMYFYLNEDIEEFLLKDAIPIEYLKDIISSIKFLDQEEYEFSDKFKQSKLYQQYLLEISI